MSPRGAFVLVVLSLVSYCTCTAYRGGTINWEYQSDGSVQINYRLGYGYGAIGCNGTATGSYVSNLAHVVSVCNTSGCINQTEPVSYYCVDADAMADWELGENSISSVPASAQFTFGFTGGPWTGLGYGAGGNWNLQARVDIRNRSDSGTSNSGPVSAALPVYSVQNNCAKTISIPTYDVDGDVVRCRWATGIECGDVCNNVTSSLPSGTLNSGTCELTISASASNGYSVGQHYLAAVMIEDFPSTGITLDGQPVTTGQPLSATPMQFLIYIDNVTSSCTDAPDIIDAPADKSEYTVPSPGYTWKQRIYVQTYGGNVPSSILLTGPRGIQQTTFTPDDKGRPSVFYTDLTWTSARENDGVNFVCVQVIDNMRLSSKQTCFTLLIGYPDPCTSGPCLNGGTCDIVFTNYTCSCPSGVYGEHCEKDIDECTWDPCDNDALCQNYVGDYKCFCRPGFGGKNCSDGEYCASNPCQGHGECFHNGSTFSCNCFDGYTGPTCQINEDNCTIAPCMNGGTCTDLVGDYLCTCPPDFTGKDCENNIDFCDPSPCKNGGACRHHPAGYVCDCPDDVIGINCELPIEQACDGDQSYCLCKIDGEPVHVPMPDPFDDDEKERYLQSGIIGYPVGLVFGACMCALFHYFVRPKCMKKGSSKRKRPSSASSTSTFSSTTLSNGSGSTADGVSNDSRRISPPPRYSSLNIHSNC